MGVAAQHRGNAVIRRQVCRELDVRQSREESRRAIQVAEDCNAFVRQAMDYLAEPRGCVRRPSRTPGLGADGLDGTPPSLLPTTPGSTSIRVTPSPFMAPASGGPRPRSSFSSLPSDAGLFRITFKYPGQPGESAREIFGNRVGQRWRPN